MLVINGVDWGYYLAMALAAALSCLLQVFLCRRVRSKLLKALPLLLCGLSLLLCLLLYLGVFGSGGGFFPADRLLALMLLIPTCLALPGIGLGWLIGRKRK